MVGLVVVVEVVVVVRFASRVARVGESIGRFFWGVELEDGQTMEGAAEEVEGVMAKGNLVDAARLFRALEMESLKLSCLILVLVSSIVDGDD